MSVISKFDLSGQTSIVTGGSQGLGEAIAIALAEAGSNIAVVVDKNIKGAEKVAERIQELGRDAIAIKANVANSSDVQRMVNEIIGKFGKIDILVNNAGVNKWMAAEEMSEETWDRVLNVDLKGVFLCSQAAGREMIKKKSGNIINISSIMGIVAQKINKEGDAVPQVHYHSSKGGVIMLTKALALEWIKHNIRVNCISPGWFLTPIVEKFFQDHKELYQVDVIERTPMKRPGKPPELGPVVVFLASNASSYMTGQNIVVDGGYTIW